MDLSAYSNLDAIGLMKERKFNKKLYNKLVERMEAISPEELAQLDRELPTAVEVAKATSGHLLVTPTAVLSIGRIGKGHFIQDIILCKNLIYVWGTTMTMRMNLIPYDKTHTIIFLDRNGNSMHSEQMHTFGLSRKDVITPALQTIRKVIEPNYPGILYGWTKEREKAMEKDFNALVQTVDEARK